MNQLHELAMTEAQKKLLAYYRGLTDKELHFPPRPCDSRNCERLESMGFLIGDLVPAEWNSRTRITVFKRAYRIHPDAQP